MPLVIWDSQVFFSSCLFRSVDMVLLLGKLKEYLT